MLITDATTVWKHLNGIICVHKPPLVSLNFLRKVIVSKLAADLNELKCREPRNYVDITGDTSQPLKVEIRQSYADHPLVLGPRYIGEEIKTRFAKPLGFKASGVCVVGINDGYKDALYLNECNPLSTFHITCQFGLATDNMFADGRSIYRCNTKYIRRQNLDTALAAIESNHQKNIMWASGFDSQSQTAYDLAATGLIRPLRRDIPVIYSIKCVNFNLPYFTLEVVLANEKEDYLLNLIDEIGFRLRNVATATAIKCIRYSYFSLEDSLLRKHITAQSILDNMVKCRHILEKNKDCDVYLKQQNEAVKKLCEEDVNEMEDYDDMEEMSKEILDPKVEKKN